MSLRKLILIRHGETDGQSSVRYYGATDVDLSAEGREQMRQVAGVLRHQAIELWVASSLQRSWKGAQLASGGRAQIKIESGLREIHFGAWEGKTAEEIKASDPVRFEDWQSGKDAFEYPNGELREAFRARIAEALVHVNATGARNAACVLHKGVIREIVRAHGRDDGSQQARARRDRRGGEDAERRVGVRGAEQRPGGARGGGGLAGELANPGEALQVARL